MIRFGPSGNSQSFYDEGHKSTTEAPSWLNGMGLNAYEYSFGLGIRLNNDTARKLHDEFVRNDVEISVHAPYYINLANESEESAEKSYAYILDSCRKLQILGGKRVVFHSSTVGKMLRKDAVALTVKRLYVLLEKIYENNLDGFYFCPEVMGKINQIGDLEEIADFCTLDRCFLPTVDFGHLNARTLGGLKTVDDFDRAVNLLLEKIGEEKTSKMHIHFSKIQYSKGGEVKHLTLEDTQYGPSFEMLAEVLVKYNLQPVIICESDGTQAEDSLKMKEIYNEIKEKK